MWNVKSRQLAWTLACSTRRCLKLDVFTTIPRAIVYLHYYFKRNPSPDYQFVQVLVGAISMSCKCDETWRSISDIRTVILKGSEFLISRRGADITSILGRMDLSINYNYNEDLEAIRRIEIEIYEALDYDIDKEQPFKYISEHYFAYITDLSQEARNQIEIGISMRIHMLFTLDTYLDYPCECVAALAVNAMDNLPKETKDWLSKLKETNNEDLTKLFNDIRSITPHKP